MNEIFRGTIVNPSTHVAGKANNSLQTDSKNGTCWKKRNHIIHSPIPHSLAIFSNKSYIDNVMSFNVC